MNRTQTNRASHETEAAPSLLDRKRLSGEYALDGFDFQRRYALIWLLESLADPDFFSIQLEVGEDVEARFDRANGKARCAVQVKNHLVDAPEAKEIIGHFDEL